MSNLSYPPLEDALLAALSVFTGGSVERVYPVYLVLLIAAELGAIVYFSRVFRRLAAQVFFLLTMLFLLHVEKPGLTFFQGLSFVDLQITGLSAEVLSFVFLLLLLRDLVAGTRSPRITVFLTLALLSHLVVGPVAFLTVLTFAAVQRRIDLAKQAGVALLLSAFFLLPFLEARGQFFTSTIFKPHPYFMATLLVFVAVFLLHDRRYLPVALTALLIALPTELDKVFEEWFGRQLFPAYHYYRLAILALVYLAVATAALLEEKRRTSRRLHLAINATVVLFLVFLLRDFHLHAYDLNLPAYRKPKIPEQLALPVGDAFERVFVIHPERACDFYLDSLFVSRGSPARFNKGLYWESSRNHVLLSSYLGTLLSTEALVLDYSYYESPTCPELQCFLDHFARDFNLGWILIPGDAQPAYLSSERARCFAETWVSGTAHFTLTRAHRFELDRRTYELYRLEPRGTELDPAVVEVVEPGQLRRLDPHRPAFFAPVLEDTMAACQRQTVNRAVYVYEPDAADLEAHLASLPEPAAMPAERPPATFRRLGRGEYALAVDAPAPVVFRVKLNYFPGFELVQAADGRRLPLYDGAGSMIGVGHGDMRLRYRRTGWMQLGYVVSGLTLVAFVAAPAVGVWRRRRAS